MSAKRRHHEGFDEPTLGCHAMPIDDPGMDLFASITLMAYQTSYWQMR